MIIGGAEDKLRTRTILTDFVIASGGKDAVIAVIPTASSLGPEVVEVYDALFRRLGAADVVTVNPHTREDAYDPELRERLASATGIFMTGGNQLKLSALLCGTPLSEEILAAHERGIVVAGTSAGASIQSSHMVAFGGPGSTPKQRMTQVAAGMGLLRSSVIDQHFDQRNRYGRLLMIVSQSPQLLGLGVDEDTSAVVEVIDGHEILRVVGRGGVTIFDPSYVVTNAYDAKRAATLMSSGVILHVLPHGSRFDLTTRSLVPPDDAEPTAEDTAELVEAGRDLRQAARDIAAADASPSALRRRLARTRTKPTTSVSPLNQDGSSS